MSAEVEYRVGPRPLDVAVRLPSGWMRIANKLRMTDAQVADWTVLEPRRDPLAASTLNPYSQRTMLLEQFEAADASGLTMKEAAAKAGLLGLPNYTSRFGSDLVKHGFIGSIDNVRRNGSTVWFVTAKGKAELARGRV